MMRRATALGLLVATAAAIAVTAGAIGSSRPAAATAAAPADQLPPEKQALVDAAASFEATAPKGDKAKDPGRPKAAQQPDTPPDTGLLGLVNAPISGSAFTPENAWSGWTDATTFTQVWAGAAPGDSAHGLIFIVRRKGSGQILDDSVAPVSSLVKAPAGGGPLKIVRVDGADLVVANPGGHEFRFNPLTGAFD